MSYFGDIYKGIGSLLTGFKVTHKYFINAPKEIVTIEYPEERPHIFDRFKGEVVMLHDDNNEHACTGCKACEIACPNGSIEIVTDKVTDEETGKKKVVIDKHIYHLSMCVFCSQCIEACPTGAISWGQEFEHAVGDRSLLTKVLNKPNSKIRDGVEELSFSDKQLRNQRNAKAV